MINRLAAAMYPCFRRSLYRPRSSASVYQDCAAEPGTASARAGEVLTRALTGLVFFCHCRRALRFGARPASCSADSRFQHELARERIRASRLPARAATPSTTISAPTLGQRPTWQQAARIGLPGHRASSQRHRPKMRRYRRRPGLPADARGKGRPGSQLGSALQK